MKAMRAGKVSVVTPFRYTRLVFGVGLSVLVFEERLDEATVVGCLLIVATGLFIKGSTLSRLRAKTSYNSGTLHRIKTV